MDTFDSLRVYLQQLDLTWHLPTFCFFVGSKLHYLVVCVSHPVSETLQQTVLLSEEDCLCPPVKFVCLKMLNGLVLITLFYSIQHASFTQVLISVPKWFLTKLIL